MPSEHDLRATRVIVRALSLRASERIGGRLSYGQLRWALEPVLCDWTVAVEPEANEFAAIATAVATRAPTSSAKVQSDRAAAVDPIRICRAVDSKGQRMY